MNQWSRLTARELAAEIARDPVVVLPVAAIEQHGPHLPLSTDVDIGEGLLRAALERLPSGFPVLVLPTEAIGASKEHGAWSGTLSRGAEALRRQLLDIGRTVAAAGARRLVFHNSHGGNKALLDEVALQLRAELGLLVVKAHWFRFPRPEVPGLAEIEWTRGLHGGAIETAMMLHLHPERVRQNEVRDFTSLEAELEGQLTWLRPEGVASFAWLADDLNPAGAIGDATQATAAMGRTLVDHFGRILAEVIDDARRFPLERLSDRSPGLDALLTPLEGDGGWVIGQLGQSVDGRIATESGHSHYINGPADLVRLHALRALADAVIVGAGTVDSDDPRLTVRRVAGPNPVRVILDPSARLSGAHHVFSDEAAPTLHMIGAEARSAAEGRAGVEVVRLATDTTDGGFAPAAVVAELRARGLQRILVEGGGLTVSRFVEAGALDRLHISVAPLLIGSGRPALTLPVIDHLDEALRPAVRRVPLGDDLVFDFELRSADPS